MSLRFKFMLALCGASCVGLIAGSLWSMAVGLIVLTVSLVGFALGHFSSTKRDFSSTALTSTSETAKEAKALASPSDEQAPASALLEATMNGMREGVLVIDQATRIVASNDAARAIFNGRSGPLESRRLSELTRNPAIHNAFRSALVNDERNEVKIELLNAERHVFDLRVVPLRLAGDEAPRGAIGVFFNITQLERLERVRQEFLSNVSHELRTPLTSILAFVETLEEGAMEDSQNGRRFLSVIRKNALRMNNLINDILELSAIEAGAVLVKIEDVRLHPMIEEIRAALASKAEAGKITIHNEVSPDAVVQADPRRLEQMLTNLLDNAIKFNREDGTVTLLYESGPRDRISVTDTGDGIPGEHLERIFERFYRVDRARSPESGGTGLGLAIVKHLARAQGGEVSVQSTPNEGSTFIIDLPARKSVGVPI